ncbi:hypothetical protein BDW67DRAFT_179144 [Aspergillus spinulosporus]
MSYLNPLPPFMNGTLARWAYVSLSAMAVLPGQFNRSALEAPWATSRISDPELSRMLAYLNTTEFVAYDRKFFDIIGPDATIEPIQKLAFQSHEAPCYIKDIDQLYFVEWGPPGGDNGTHSWQYLLDVKTNELREITTDPPTYNAHGCVVYDGFLYVVTDGYGDEQSGQLVKINPRTLKKEVLLNNFLVQPFGGFNDLEIDPQGNFYLTDSKSGWGRGIVDFAMPTNPTVYFVERDTFRIKPVHITNGNANGVAVSPDGNVIYIPNTGVSSYYPVTKSPYGKRELWAFDISQSGAVLTNKRLLSNPISYFFDGVRVSRNGFGRNELWIVGRGGVWHVKDIRDRLDRKW